MKFTKEMWAKLKQEERSWLVHYHKNCNECGYCPVCGYPQMGELVCIKCIERANKLYTKMGVIK